MGYRRWTRGKRVQDKRREGWRQEEGQGDLLATVRGAGCSYRNCVCSLAKDVIKVQQLIIRPLSHRHPWPLTVSSSQHGVVIVRQKQVSAPRQYLPPPHYRVLPA
jgi:hypothetical protein